MSCQYHGHEWTTHILFVPRQSATPFLIQSYFRLWPWYSKVKFMAMAKGQGHELNCISNTNVTRYVDSTPMSEVTPVTIRYIRPPHHGHTSQYHGHEWMTHILFVPRQSATPFLIQSYFRLWPWYSKVKVMGVAKGQGHELNCISNTNVTRYVDGTPTSEVTPVTIWYIRPPHHGHTCQYHGHEWMTHILFIPCQSAVPFLR